MAPSGEERQKNHDEQVAALFEELCDATVDRRREVFEERGTPEPVRREVETMLDCEVQTMFTEEALGNFGSTAVSASHSWGSGTVLGDYEIIREIARGGMGVVFEAKQLSLGRRVAIKVILSSRLAKADDVQRFRTEAESVAQLDHPGIVPVYEVCEFEGEQFFSMAFVGGGSLASANVPLAPRRAAELVADIAEAVHYAHTRNIVHRDLKPGNVLLSDSGNPKITDFGLAKNTDEDSNLTVTGSILGTPGFMAPEQALGKSDAVGPLADVYALGGLLYYLVSGRAPVEGATIVDALHELVHGEPAPLRRIDPSIPKDLEAICTRCLEKDPASRYASAAEVARELGRFLRHEPTQARPLTQPQRLARWCRRNPVVAALSFTAAAAVLTGSVVSTWFGVVANDRATELDEKNTKLANTIGELNSANEKLQRQSEDLAKSRDDAQAAAREARSFSGFLTHDVISAARPRVSTDWKGVDTTIREALVAATKKIGERFKGSPKAEALARHEIGVTLRRASMWKLAREQLELALRIRREVLGPDHAETLDTHNSLTVCLFDMKLFEESEAMSLEILKRLPAGHPGRAAREQSLAILYSSTGRYAEAIPILERKLAAAKGHVPVIEAKLELGGCYKNAGREEEGLRMIAEARAAAHQHLGEHADERLWADSNYGEALTESGRAEEAVGVLDPSVAAHVHVYTERHQRTVLVRSRHADALLALDRYAEAAPVLETMLPNAIAVFGEDDAFAWMGKEDLGKCYHRLDQPKKALPLLRDALIHRRRKSGPSHPKTLRTQFRLAMSHRLTRNDDEAVRLLEDADRQMQGWDEDGQRHPFRAQPIQMLVQIETRRKRAEAARKWQARLDAWRRKWQ